MALIHILWWFSTIVKPIEEVGALVYFLPPYSPDFNPIEELFFESENHAQIFKATTGDTIHTEV